MSLPSGAGGGAQPQQPYIPTEAEQAEHLHNLMTRLQEFWLEQGAEVRPCRCAVAAAVSVKCSELVRSPAANSYREGRHETGAAVVD